MSLPGAITLLLTTKNVSQFASSEEKYILIFTCGWTLVGNDLAESTPQGVNILALYFEYLETMSFKSLGQLVALKILRRVTSDSDIIVIWNLLGSTNKEREVKDEHTNQSRV